jgi:hypothetical protein
MRGARTWTDRDRAAATIRLARTDPETFAALMLAADPAAEIPPLPALHRTLQRHLSSPGHALVEFPRDHGKTTQVMLRVLWELGRNPALRVRIVCASETIARDRSRYLRRCIESSATLRAVFPQLQRGEPWTATAFSVARPAGILGPSVAAFGIHAASTGTRADLLVCDDIVDVKAIHSKAERDRTADDFFNNLLNLLEPHGRFWGLSTPWHADDLNARLRKNDAFRLLRKAIDPDLTPVWPRHWPSERLVQRRAEIGSAAFARGYRLTPLAEDEVVIRPEWVQCWETQPERYERVILSVDPAVSVKASADASAIVVLGKTGNTVHCLASAAKRVPAPGLVEWIDALDGLWTPHEIVFESNGAFDAVRELLVRHARFGPKVAGVKQSRSKLAFLLPPDGSQRSLREEMTSYPFGERDDLLDAAATGAARLLAMRPEPRLWIF